MMDDAALDADNERHKREEHERRAKRKAARDAKAKSDSQTEKERKRREHAQRILQAQNKKHKSGSTPATRTSAAPKSHSPATPSASVVEGGSSIFQSLFHQRAEGFLIDLRFRNAPPRPPVGPCFVGPGLEGELTDKWTRYKARNAVEKSYVWKLHSEADLGVPLAVSALDYEGCYTDPEKVAATRAKDHASGVGGGGSNAESKDGSGGTTEGGGKEGGGGEGSTNKPHVIPPLHPDDDALIHWKGSMGDTSAEQLQQKRDRARAAARLAIARGFGSPNPTALSSGGAAPKNNNNNTTTPTTATVKLKTKSHLQSRILDEKIPHFMKKTTYLTNDATSVHRFTSLAHTQAERAKDVDRALAETKTKYTETDIIERGFMEANKWEVVRVVDGAAASKENGTATAATSATKKRSHPTKPNVYPVWDLPLLPDVVTWGHTYTHVVVDNPPKSVNNENTSTKNAAQEKKEKHGNLVSGKQLQKAIVADVTKQADSARMACTMWVPGVEERKDDTSMPPPPAAAAKKIKKGDFYQAVQRYDLDVVPLREASAPEVHYVWMIDPSKNYAGYHPVGSRVQLSTGRPINLSNGNTSSGAEISTDRSIVSRRALEEDEKRDVEKRMAEVDVDLAEKYGMAEGGNVRGSASSAGGKGGQEGGDNGQKRRSIADSDDSEMEEDAF